MKNKLPNLFEFLLKAIIFVIGCGLVYWTCVFAYQIGSAIFGGK